MQRRRQPWTGWGQGLQGCAAALPNPSQHCLCALPALQDAASAPESGTERPGEKGDVRARTTGPLPSSAVRRWQRRSVAAAHLLCAPAPPAVRTCPTCSALHAPWPMAQEGQSDKEKNAPESGGVRDRTAGTVRRKGAAYSAAHETQPPHCAALCVVPPACRATLQSRTPEAGRRCTVCALLPASLPGGRRVHCDHCSPALRSPAPSCVLYCRRPMGGGVWQSLQAPVLPAPLSGCHTPPPQTAAPTRLHWTTALRSG